MEDIIHEDDLYENHPVECAECTEWDLGSEMKDDLCPRCVGSYEHEAQEELRAMNAWFDGQIAYSLRGYR